MDSILHIESLSLTRLRATSTSTASIHHMPCQLVFSPVHRPLFPLYTLNVGFGSRRSSTSVVAASGSLTANSVSPRGGVYTVGDFMTKKEDLHVVRPTTTVDEALEALVEHRITGFPVIDDDWKLVGLVSDYDLLALDSISGRGLRTTCSLKLIALGKLSMRYRIVRETTNLEDAARLLLETKYRRLPVVDVDGKLVGIITRGNVVRAALQIKREIEGKA
ncbi:hypothetical protein V6N13_043972 [Hibiscus sabdariffa]|uniref:CBS domain-containing protein n=1 Tax=Hibiscus sabdariffa TaxID=183260 RepID=A0ABR2RHG1_9ROSI